jgi:hypothetical protein
MQATPRLEPEEQQLLDDFEAGALHSVVSPELFTQLRAAARSTGQKDQRINFVCPVPPTFKPCGHALYRKEFLIKR